MEGGGGEGGDGGDGGDGRRKCWGVEGMSSWGLGWGGRWRFISMFSIRGGIENKRWRRGSRAIPQETPLGQVFEVGSTDM